jgi:plasmid replication initiation protein
MGKKRNDEKPVRLIAKSNRLIEARHNLDIWELRIFTKMLMMVDGDDSILDYVIPIREIISDFELSDSQTSYVAIREAADKLLGRKVYIYKHIEGERWERQATTLIKKYAVPVVKTIDGKFVEVNDKNNYIRIGFDEDVRDMIVNYKDSFTRLNLNVLARLSPKSFRMYELLKQYEDTGFRTMTLDELRDIFDLTGQYKLYGSIKQRIIDKAQKDLEKYADITFTYNEIKQGRAVYRVNFSIKSKSPRVKGLAQSAKSSSPTPSVINLNLLNELNDTLGKELKVNPSVMQQLVEQFDELRLRNAVDITRKAMSTGKIKGNAAGYFVEAVREGYSLNQPLKKNNKTKEPPKPIDKTPPAADINETKKVQFEKEKQHINTLLAESADLRRKVIERIQSGMFRDFFDETKSFEENLEKPALYGVVANIVRELTVNT